MKEIICGEDTDIQPYDYKTLLETIPKFAGTSKGEQDEKLKRKFRRVYELCNKRLDDNQMLKERINELKEDK